MLPYHDIRCMLYTSNILEIFVAPRFHVFQKNQKRCKMQKKRKIEDRIFLKLIIKYIMVIAIFEEKIKKLLERIFEFLYFYFC